MDVGANGVTEASPSRTPARATLGASFRLHVGEGIAPRMAIAIGLSLISAAVLVGMSGHNPLAAFAAMAMGAVGSPHQIGVALNRATPYLLAGGGVAICFRAGVINIGAEGQIALGGAGAAAVALHWPNSASVLTVVATLLGAAAFGAFWAAVAAAIHLGRRVHEVLVTLLLNFVALLLVQQALSGPLGQFGAGFLQSPAMPPAATLWRLPEFGVHAGFLIALVAAAALSLALWRTPFGFAVRVAGSSRRAAAYAGFSIPRITWGVMLLAGALAGLAGGVEVLGVHHRLIEGFSLGFGFKAVTVALLGALEPLAVVPAAIFVGMLEAGSLSMQRQIGVPSALIFVIEGVTMLFVLAATVRRT
jgi:general nucleoside transport system permease protein